ncbi:hypothetical protein [Frankia sp. AgB32]|uniref:hypothetical protein n=1 Tax=Frankia sp. AgB32 TaxID=631119 RepID=UPI00200DE3D1|nr:hypothetical protein [Frankia sp. AgB32]MCK9896181.1 hypothetical protein [Frankia sp. AgB32]
MTTTAALAAPLPPPARVDYPHSVTNCGLLSPQFVFPGYAGPQRGFIPGPPAINSEGKSVLRGAIAEGEIALDVRNGGCGLSATLHLETKFCHKQLWYTDCSWEGISKQYTYDEIPTNGVRVFPPLQIALRKGSNSYRLSVDVRSNNLATVQGKGRFPGAVLPGSESKPYFGPEVKITG